MIIIKGFHFCSNDFLSELQKNQIIYADNIIRSRKGSPETYVKNYVFNKKRINNGNGMFFAWSNPYYKGKIEFNEEGQYSLLELDIDDDIVIKTNYENWCSLGCDIEEADGDLDLADEICRKEFGIRNGLEGSYEGIYYMGDKKAEIQLLFPYIKYEWILSIKKCEYPVV